MLVPINRGNKKNKHNTKKYKSGSDADGGGAATTARNYTTHDTGDRKPQRKFGSRI